MNDISAEENIKETKQSPKSLIFTVIAVVIGSVVGGFVYDAVLKEAIFGPEQEPYREIIYDEPVSDDGKIVSSDDPDGWVLYRTEDRGFEVLFPTEPEYQMGSQLVAGTDVTVRVHIYSSEISKLFYVVGANTIPVDDKEPTEWGRSDLDNMVQGTLNNLPYARVTGKEYVDFNGIEAVDLKTVDDQTGYHLRYFMFGYGDKTYSLGVVSEQGAIPEKDFKKFTESFNLLSLSSQ